MKKMIALLLCGLVLLGMLAGCKKAAAPNNNPNSTTTPPTGAGSQGPVVAKGVLVVTANASVTIAYDVDGLVQKLEANNPEAEELLETYDDQTGFDCSVVVTKIVKDCVAKSMGQMTHVMIKQTKGSGNPTEDFMKNIESVVTTAMTNANSTAKLVMVTPEQQDNNAHIDPKVAKTLVMAFLGVDKLDSIYGTEKPVEGYYSFYVTCDDMEEEVHVNAVTGAVGQGVLSDITQEEPVDPKEEQQATQPQESTPTTTP